MNYARLALTAVVAWVVDSIYGFLVFGVALNSEFDRYRPGVFRSVDAINANLPLMFAASLIGLFFLAYIFAKGYEGGPGLQEGLRFGVVVGLFELFGIWIPDYAVYNYGRKLAAETAVAGFIDVVIVGIVFGLMYKPGPSVRRAVA